MSSSHTKHFKPSTNIEHSRPSASSLAPMPSSQAEHSKLNSQPSIPDGQASHGRAFNGRAPDGQGRALRPRTQGLTIQGDQSTMILFIISSLAISRNHSKALPNLSIGGGLIEANLAGLSLLCVQIYNSR